MGAWQCATYMDVGSAGFAGARLLPLERVKLCFSPGIHFVMGNVGILGTQFRSTFQ